MHVQRDCGTELERSVDARKDGFAPVDVHPALFAGIEDFLTAGRTVQESLQLAALEASTADAARYGPIARVAAAGADISAARRVATCCISLSKAWHPVKGQKNRQPQA